MKRAPLYFAALLLASLLLLPERAAAQLLRSPIGCDSCISDWYYVDQGFQTDWNCGGSTYSDHTGSDYSLRNGNFAIDNDNEVVAMAAGTVVKTEDGYYDRCTQCGGLNCGTNFGNGFANQVVINHGPYRMIYGHMKMGSIAVQQGDTVECGQVIGFMGSSGCSTGAHLHIEPSLAANFGVGAYTPIDPYAGECSDTDPSLFVEQGSYRALPSTGCDGSPPVPVCPADTYAIWTCTQDLGARRRCVDGVVSDETCASGCTAMPTGTDDVCALPPDGDADGSRADVDCQDANAAVHPGAVEICGDGIDQECSGADAPCPPTGAAGAAGAPMMPPQGQAGMPAAAGQPAPPLGQAGQPAFGQAGAAAPGVSPTPFGTSMRRSDDSGCRVSSSARAALPDGLPGCLALLWIARRRRRRADTRPDTDTCPA